MTDQKDKVFREGTIPLDDQKLEELARIMESLTEEDIRSIDDARLDQDLFERFGSMMPERSMQRDPTSMNDEELWKRIHAAKVPVSRTARSPWFIWAGAASIAAGLILSLLNWQSENTGESMLKGSGGKGGCELAYRANGMTVNPENQGVGVPGARSILLVARCQDEGFLQLELISGSERTTIANIPVQESGEYLALSDQGGNPIGIMTPADGVLTISLGFSKGLWNVEAGVDQTLSQREVHWPIERQEAVP